MSRHRWQVFAALIVAWPFLAGTLGTPTAQRDLQAYVETQPKLGPTSGYYSDLAQAQRWQSFLWIGGVVGAAGLLLAYGAERRRANRAAYAGVVSFLAAVGRGARKTKRGLEQVRKDVAAKMD